MKKITSIILCVLLLAVVCTPTVAAVSDYPLGDVYETYIYNSENEPVIIPETFEVSRTVTGDDLSVGDFNTLSDLCRNDNGEIFLCDSGNNRIVITDSSWQSATSVSEFVYQGATETFQNPQGVWADESRVYVADTGNARIVQFDLRDSTLNAVEIYERPEIRALGEDYTYSPTRLAVDAVGRMYVVAAGINQGLLCFDENGRFQNFLGAPPVELNILEMLWRRIATKEQLLPNGELCSDRIQRCYDGCIRLFVCCIPDIQLGSCRKAQQRWGQCAGGAEIGLLRGLCLSE